MGGETWKKAGKMPKEQLRLLRLRLGMGKGDEFPRCPHRAEERLRELVNAGEAWHGVDDHICVRCGCLHVAGAGTAHYGYGRCSFHEKHYTEWENKMAADRHMEALTMRDPGLYRDVGAFTGMVRRDAADGEKRLGLVDETQIARGLLQEIILKANGKWVNPATGEIELLTEYSNGFKVPMSDKTRIELMAKVLPRITEMVKAETDLETMNAITHSMFQVWFGKVWSMMQETTRRLDAGELKTGIELREAFKDGFNAIGEPRKRRS